MTTNPESPLIQKLAEVRQALQAEREALLARVSAIDEALAVGMPASTVPKTAKPAKAAPKEAKPPRATGVREAIIGALNGKPGLTIKQLQEALPEYPAKTVESTTHVMASSGLLAKDGSSPKRFSLPVAPKTNGVSASA
jgi:hypothetical protein